jgi:hypothetical protein
MMNAKDLTLRLLEDLQKANEVSLNAKSLSQIMAQASSIQDMKLFTAESWITVGLSTLKTSLFQLTQILRSRKELESLDSSGDISTLLKGVKENQAIVEDFIGQLLAGQYVTIPTSPPISGIIVKILGDINSDVFSLYGTYLNIKDKR